MRKLFEFNQHIGRWRVLVQTSDINNKAVTKEKLSDDLWKEICRMASDELLVAVFGVTTYETALYYYENEKTIIGKSGDLYFNMVRFDDGEFVFTQVDERGTLHTMVLSVDGWSDSVAQMELATAEDLSDLEEGIADDIKDRKTKLLTKDARGYYQHSGRLCGIVYNNNGNISKIVTVETNTNPVDEDINSGEKVLVLPYEIVESMIADGAVTTVKMADGSVTTAKIVDGNVTKAKLAQEVLDFLEEYLADFKGTVTTVAALKALTGDKNDWAVLQTTDANGNTVYSRYRYDENYNDATTGHWRFELNINNSSFTAAQWAAINSGINSAIDLLDYTTVGASFPKTTKQIFSWSDQPAIVTRAEVPDNYVPGETETHLELICYVPAVIGYGNYGTFYVWTENFNSQLQKDFWVFKGYYDVVTLQRNTPEHPLLKLFSLNEASQHQSGLMSAAHYSKLDAIEYATDSDIEDLFS